MAQDLLLQAPNKIQFFEALQPISQLFILGISVKLTEIHVHMEIDGYVYWNSVAGKNLHNERIDINIFNRRYMIISLLRNNPFMCTYSKQLFYVVYLNSKVEIIQYT